MKCPVCGSDIPDGTLTCPYCDSDVSVTRTRMRPLNRWCSVCGALVSDDMEACPTCGSPLEPTGAPVAGEPDREAVPDEPEDEPDPDATARLEAPSAQMDDAIPAPGAGPTSRVRSQTGMRALVLALVAAVAVMGGTILYITHPWNPGSSKHDKETIEVDTTSAGSPGVVSAIGAQDGEAGTPRLGTPGSRSTFEWESDAYVMIEDVAAQLADNQALLESVGAGEVTSGLDEGADACDSLARQLAALSSDLASATPEDAYADDVERLEQLVGWLSSWAASLDDGWDGVTAAEPAERAAVVDAALAESGVTDGRALFEQNVEAWAPVDRG